MEGLKTMYLLALKHSAIGQFLAQSIRKDCELLGNGVLCASGQNENGIVQLQNI